MTDQLEAGAVLVRGPANAFAQDIIAGKHHLKADEKPPAGEDAGPDPYDLLLAALGTCTSMTVAAHARRSGIPLVSVEVQLRRTRLAPGLERIDREIALDGPLDADQRTHLREIAERCPVHRTLTGRIEIATRLVSP